MRPRAACVTEGHKSPVSLPPPWPRTVWRKRIQSSLSSTLLNPIVCYWKWKQQSQTLTALIYLGIAFEIALHLANQAIKIKSSSQFQENKTMMYPRGSSPTLAKQSVVAHSLEEGLHKSSDGWILTLVSPVAEEGMLVHQRSRCLLTNPVQRWHTIS